MLVFIRLGKLSVCIHIKPYLAVTIQDFIALKKYQPNRRAGKKRMIKLRILKFKGVFGINNLAIFLLRFLFASYPKKWVKYLVLLLA